MFVVGLTGGIAAGKSTVALRLVEHGAELIDADLVAREVVLPGTPTWHRIVEHFGDEVVGEDGFLDREKLGRIVFEDPSRRRLLNELTHPPILREIADRLEVMADRGGMVVVDMALLVEMQTQLEFDAVVVVASGEEQQEQRLVHERGMGLEQARQRIAAQSPLEEKLALATHVISNEGSLRDLRMRTDEVAKELAALAEAKRRGA